MLRLGSLGIARRWVTCNAGLPRRGLSPFGAWFLLFTQMMRHVKGKPLAHVWYCPS